MLVPMGAGGVPITHLSSGCAGVAGKRPYSGLPLSA